MILYNFPYRGPYEYDKFILNVFQFHNESVRIKKEILGLDDKEEGIVRFKKDFEAYYQKWVNEDSLSEKIYDLSLYLK